MLLYSAPSVENRDFIYLLEELIRHKIKIYQGRRCESEFYLFTHLWNYVNSVEVFQEAL